MQLTVVTYNVLAQAYTDPSYYPHLDPADLAPERRQPVLLDQLVQLAQQGAQVILLQEVEPALHQRLEPRLRSLGYQGVYAQKGAGRPDGCATFYHEQLALRDQRVLRYADGVAGRADSGHLALILSLMHPAHPAPLRIANTHLRWEPETTPASQRLAGRELAELLANLVPERVGAPPVGPLILGGDFNLRPDSPILEQVRAAGLLDSHAGPAGAARAPTAFANGRASSLDYLWHSADLRAAPRPLPPLGPEAPIPAPGQPSDHLPLCASFSADA